MKAFWQHYRVSFSFILLPIFLFALTTNVQLVYLNKTWLLFFIFHLLVYPSSIAYNSIQDRDTGSVGLVKEPLAVPKYLTHFTILIDIIAILLAYTISIDVAKLVALFIIISRLYSWRKVRLKQYPILGFIAVSLGQGFGVYFTVMVLQVYLPFTTDIHNINIAYGIVSFLLIGAGYPISQIYQHKQDAADGVQTISIKLGIKGTIYFSAMLYGILQLLLELYYFENMFMRIAYYVCMLPATITFLLWVKNIWKNTDAANYKNTTIQTIWAAIGFNVYFILILIYKIVLSLEID